MSTFESLQRVSFARVWALAFVLIAVVHAGSLQDPPYWDALLGAFSQGHWLATHSFSPLALLRDAGAFNDGGACVYPFSVYPWIAGALEASGLAPASVFLVLHVVSFVAAAAVIAALFGLVRDAAGPGLAALAALALVVQPMFRALACQMNMDMPLAACTLLSILALTRGRFRAAGAWAALALLVKPTAVILIVANLAALLVRLARPAWFQLDDDGRRRARTALVVHALLLGVFLAEMVVAARFGMSAPGVSLFGGLAPFLFRRVWTLPEFGLALAVFLLLVPWIGLRIRRGRAAGVEIDLALFLLAFTGFFCQYVNVLPRYFLQAWPILLAALVLAALACGVPRRAVGVGLAALALFGLVNQHGRFHPTRYADWNEPGSTRPLVSNDGWLLERSLEYRDDLELDQAMAASLERRRDAVVVANWPLLQLLAIPALGYVRDPPRLACEEVPIGFAPAPVPRARDIPPGKSVVRAITPNVYCSDSTRVLPQDEILEVVARGRLRAFIVRRPADSEPERR